MFFKRFLCCLTAVLFLSGSAAAARADSDIHCFSAEDFGDGTLTGICITQLPGADTGTVQLGSRTLRPGDILTAAQLEQLTFRCVPSQRDRQAAMTYLPIYDDRVDSAAVVTLQLPGREDQPPTAEDFVLETYKNLPNQGVLKARDPEGQALTYTVLRQPKRGTLELKEDGSFTYTPKKNKVGTDSFVYTATDPAGNVSREATVTLQILKPTAARQYTDTLGDSCRFAAEWLKNTGIFVGEQLDGQPCFRPEKTVTRGEFLTMLLRSLDIGVEEGALCAGYEDAPEWLKPYLAAAVRTGMLAGLPQWDAPALETGITGAEAALMLQNLMDLAVVNVAAPEVQEDPGAKEMSGGLEDTLPASAPAAPEDIALAVMADNGICLSRDAALTRAQAADILYRASCLADAAPGLTVLR